ncbi:hypothetical protein KXX11_000482 [Aspergillus fumigatus]|nr:hypothetical protein KXX11_000482 [Aspergillus fumigatus]
MTTLRAEGAVGVAYAQLFSREHFNTLQRAARMQEQLRTAPQSKPWAMVLLTTLAFMLAMVMGVFIVRAREVPGIRYAEDKPQRFHIGHVPRLGGLAVMAGVVGMLAEWTDERRVVGLGGEKILAGVPTSSSPCGFVHLALVKDILERVLGISTGPNRCSKEEKKLLFSLLSKLYISPPVVPSRSGSRMPEGDDQFRSSIQSASGGEISPENVALAQEVKELLDETIQEGVAAEAAGRNALVKVKNAVLKLLAAAQGIRSDSVRPREGTEEPESDAMSIRSGSVQPSIEHPGKRRRMFSVEPSIMEEDENDDSRGTIIKSEAHDD